MSAKDQANIKSADSWRHRMRDWFAFPRARVVATHRPVTIEELKQHNNMQGSCWIAISGVVYDVTNFISMHPGGAAVFRAVAGKDATAQYNRHHARFTAAEAIPELIVGPLVGADASDVDSSPVAGGSAIAGPPRSPTSTPPPPHSLASATTAVAVAAIGGGGSMTVIPPTDAVSTTPTPSGSPNEIAKSEATTVAPTTASTGSNNSTSTPLTATTAAVDEERRALEELYESLVIPPATTLSIQELALFLESAGVTQEEMAATSQRLTRLGKQGGPIDRETFIALF